MIVPRVHELLIVLNRIEIDTKNMAYHFFMPQGLEVQCHSVTALPWSKGEDE